MAGEIITVPGCKGTTVEELVSENDIQILKVMVEPGGEIPLHTHKCAATMVVVKGEAKVLGKKDKQIANQGDIIVKSSMEPHGFTDVKKPFCFVSISDGKGILQNDGWDLKFMY